jgi:hypothetical protein
MTPPPTAQRLTLKQRRDREQGTALTEFVVIMPLFILLLFWSEFFVDLGLVKLKAEEAARYALWEMTAQRDPGAIQAEVSQRFKDLSSPADINSSAPVGVRSFKNVTISTVSIVNNINAPFEGNLQLGWGGGGGGFLNAMLRGIGGLIGRTVDRLVQKMGFETHREAQATIEFQVTNSLFPGGKLNGAAEGKLYEINEPGRALNLTIRTKSPPMLVDTWKAWPGPFASGSKNTNTDIYDTYARNGGASAPEAEVSSRMSKMAFFGLQNNIIMRIVGFTFTLTGFRDPFSTKTWKDKSGPICMLPGDNALHSWAPGSGLGSLRLGDRIYPQAAALQQPFDSPNTGTDRPRSTVPGRLHTGWWNSEGGMTSVPRAVSFTNTQNAYQAEYACRDAFYMGSTVPGLKRYGDSNANMKAFPLCR